MSPSRFNSVPKDIDGIIIVLDEVCQRLDKLEESNNQFKAALVKGLVGLIAVICAKFGIDVSGVTF